MDTLDNPAETWHRRFEQQAAWTAQTRHYLLRKLSLGRRARILEVGCGTGAVTKQLRTETGGLTYGLDLDLELLRFAAMNDSKTRFTGGNALALPYPTDTFDAVTCHFFLLWISKPGLALAEMVRVTRPGGSILALAEPDYGGRIDAPSALESLGRLQAESLRQQGAATNRGRELAELLHAAGLRDVETGLLGGQWKERPVDAEIDQEWVVLAADLKNLLSGTELVRLEKINRKAWQEGSRVLFVPTFYGMGNKPQPMKRG